MHTFALPALVCSITVVAGHACMRVAPACPMAARVLTGPYGLNAGEVFESSLQLVKSNSGDGATFLVCLCAYLCHSLIQQGRLEAELGETFVTSILAKLLHLPQQPLAERVACDLFRQWAQVFLFLLFLCFTY